MNVHLLINRGVLSIAWSVADPELLLSCGKDSRILCWNPNTAEVKKDLLMLREPVDLPVLVKPSNIAGAVRAAHQQPVVLRHPVVSQEPCSAVCSRL